MGHGDSDEYNVLNTCARHTKQSYVTLEVEKFTAVPRWDSHPRLTVHDIPIWNFRIHVIT